MIKNGRTLIDQMINHYLMDRCWQNKPGYLLDGRAAVSCLEYSVVSDRTSLILSGIF